MKTLFNIEGWSRKEHYHFFSRFEEPFFGVTVTVDCTKAYHLVKEKKQSFFLYYLYRALKTANEIENFRYRIIDDKVYLFDQINASPTISRANNTFGFAYLDYHKEEPIFYEKALQEIDKVQKTNSLVTAAPSENVILVSALPWLNFSALSHARSFSFPDSSPKISFGKVTEKQGQKTMPVSIHVHHGLMDGYHVGLFVDRFQELLNEV
ncbi:chloramphenicol acetyltransferase [Cesiribacter sp. SM1]|uniref:chloramphenicol acetyltransferase n=1 Tax=Cesiribacter sp. SM1 TaxID=2861196 RepID=UPI001CD2EB71|nr:chloramphenicol acetyltransferase [Cesiribacter sp. SM1]